MITEKDSLHTEFLSSYQFKDRRLANPSVIAAELSINEKYGNQGYRAHSDFTHELSFGSFKLKSHNPPFTMCVSFQFELLLTAIEDDFAKSHKTRYDYVKQSEWFGLNGLSLQNCVWENERCHGVGQALEIFGMGQQLDFDRLEPGCFISYDHFKGGHSVCFLGYLNADGILLNSYDPSVAGFRFVASNGFAAKGDGISFRDGVLSSKSIKQGRHKQATGIKNIRAGALYRSELWQRVKFDEFVRDFGPLFVDLKPQIPSGQE